MMSKDDIHYMFYENGKTKDRQDPSQRVTSKLYWSKYFHSEIINQVEQEFSKPIRKMEGMPFIANLAYSGYAFIEAICAWKKIANTTAINLNPDIIKKSKVELYAFLGYIDALEKNISNVKKDSIINDSIFSFTNFKQLLMCCGIRFEDSKVISRANNLKKLITSSLNARKFPISKVKEELNMQYKFLHGILKEICFAEEEDFIVYLLRYDLRKVF